MKTIHSAFEMRRQASAWRSEHKTIAFVPTMGALHEGHLSLLREGRKWADILVASIFVNPTQFAPHEDFAKYPRPFDADYAKCIDCDVDALFAPTAEEMYPDGDQTVIDVHGLSQGLCGPFRPGHFRGVATVVYKLFAMVFPTIALFGEKDFQQLRVIERMAADLLLPVTIVPMPTIREADGLAMSSRNQYLSLSERKQAVTIYKALQRANGLARETDDVATITNVLTAMLNEVGITKIDYVAIVDAATLEPLTHLDPPSGAARCCIAAYVGTTRLIDNGPVGVNAPALV